MKHHVIVIDFADHGRGNTRAIPFHQGNYNNALQIIHGQGTKHERFSCAREFDIVVHCG